MQVFAQPASMNGGDYSRQINGQLTAQLEFWMVSLQISHTKMSHTKMSHAKYDQVEK